MTEPQPIEPQSAAAKPAESTPATAKPAGSKPVESKPAESLCVRSHRRRTRLVVALLIAAATGGVVVKYTRHYVFAKNFGVVVPGRLYRSGYNQPWPLTRIIHDCKIKTILVLLQYDPDSKDQQAEAAVAKREGVRMIRIGMPGDGRADFDKLEQAADVINDPSNYPLLVHCYAGTNRTGAAYAVWRMRHCGWNYQRTMDECEDYELSPRYRAKLFAHLKRYYTERIEGRRAGAEAQTAPARVASRPAA